jgi:geranylgeranyl pyrophosphate synthase
VIPADWTERAAESVERHLGHFRDKLEALVPVHAIEAETTALARAAAQASASASSTHPAANGQSADPQGPVSFGARMEWFRGLTMAAIDRAIPSAGPQRQLYEPIREFVARPSKGLRPALCLATCLAYGGRLSDALPSAAGIELLHNAFLVHDDIEDGSEVRRGRPTLHRTLGTPLAINVGDAMNALSMGLFRQNVDRLGPEAALRIFDDVDHMLRESLEGQALELGWNGDRTCDVTTDDYLRLVLKKTAWYSFIHPMRIGASIACNDRAALERFHAFGFLLGAAFQIQDDVLNLAGSQALYGKEIGGDLWERKRTLPLIRALATGTDAERRILEHFVTRPREGRLPRQVSEVLKVLKESGSLDWARQVADALARGAAERLPAAFVGAREGPDLDFIRSLVSYIAEREL